MQKIDGRLKPPANCARSLGSLPKSPTTGYKYNTRYNSKPQPISHKIPKVDLGKPYFCGGEVRAEFYQDASEETEVGLKAIATENMSPDNGNATVVGDNGSMEDDVAFDKNQDSSSSSSDEEISNNETTPHIEAGESSGVAGEVVEEEIVELEFEKVNPKHKTHSMHCPNCNSEVTKVVLRRKVITTRPSATPVDQPQRDPDDLVGCLSCLSLFTCLGNGCFNPFDIFRKKPDPTPQTTLAGTTTTTTTPVVTENENCLSMFLVFKRKQKVTETTNPPQTDPEHTDRDFTIPDQPATAPKFVTGTASIGKGQSSIASPPPPSTIIVEDNNNKDKITIGESYTGPLIPLSNPQVEDDTTIDVDTAIDVAIEPENNATVEGRRRWLGYEGILAEILKSVVYGGLMEVIASLSIVASAAASETATLNIIALALASLIGGIIVLWHNLWDLRDDCHKENPNQQTEGEAINKYKELFGRINYFPLHAFFAILSFIIFGMVPPIAYGFSFYKTDDRDFTMLVVAIVSLSCVALLAVFKAFINECGVLEYFKTVVYYITTAVSASGVSYVAGNLVLRLVKELGLFDTSSGGGLSLLPHATTTSLASF